MAYISTLVNSMVQSKAFMSALLTWLVAQVCKATIQKLKYRENKWWTVFFLKTGGMPSSHSALVTSICVVFIFEYGWLSPLTTLTYFYGLIVVRDSFGVRRSVGLLVEQLAEIKKELGYEAESKSFLQYVQGHTPLEVTVGAVIGLGVTFFVHFLFL